MRRFRACWSIQAPSGLLVQATYSIRRLPTQMNARTYNRLVGCFERQGRRRAKPRPGDVAIFDWDRNGIGVTTAIYIGKGRVVRFHIEPGSASRLVLAPAEVAGADTRFRRYLR